MAIAADFDLLAFLRKNHFLSASQLEMIEQDKSRNLTAEVLSQELVRSNVLTNYQRDQILVGEGQKLVIGPYRLMEPVGEGGMGMVFKAWQPRLDRTVAIKLIRPQVLATKPEVLTRFHREAKAIAQLNHPNVVMLYDADELEGIHYIAMEYVDGMTFEKMVRSNGPLSIKQACEYMRQCALGLQHAAECGLVHRDIKPSNILVTHRSNGAAKRSSSSLRRPSLVTVRDRDLNMSRDKSAEENQAINNWGTIKILDMGLARLNESVEDPSPNTPLTRAGALLGTPDFISPEQARDASAVDIRSDLYSLGCTFYYILTGRPPFPGGTDVQKILRHQTDTPVPLEEMRPNIPMPVVTITKRLLMKRPEDRFGSPKQLADLLDQYLNGRDNPMPVAITAQEDAAPKQDDMAVAAISDSQLLDSIDIETGTPLPLADIYTETDGPVYQTEMAAPSDLRLMQSSSMGIISAHNGLVTSLSMARHGRLCASGGIDGTARLWDISKPTPVELAMLPRGEVEIQAVALAPDEPYVIVGGTLNNQARLWRWDYQEEKVYDWGTFDEKHGVNCIEFSPDGRMMTVSVGHIIYTNKISNRNYSGRSALKGHNNLIRSLAVSPDRRLVASGSEGRNIRIWSNGWLGSTSKAKLEGHSDIVTALAFSPNSKRFASAGLDRTVVLWDALTPSLDTAVPLMGHSNNIRLLHFLPGNQYLLSVGEAGEIFLWNIHKRERVAECKTGQILSSALAISESGRRLAAGTSDGRIQLFELSLPIYNENSRTMLAANSLVSC